MRLVQTVSRDLSRSVGRTPSSRTLLFESFSMFFARSKIVHDFDFISIVCFESNTTERRDAIVTQQRRPGQPKTGPEKEAQILRGYCQWNLVGCGNPFFCVQNVQRERHQQLGKH